MSRCGAAIVGQRAEQRIGVDQVRWVEGDGGCVGEEVVAQRGDSPPVIGEVTAVAVGEETGKDCERGGAGGGAVQDATPGSRDCGRTREESDDGGAAAEGGGGD